MDHKLFSGTELETLSYLPEIKGYLFFKKGSPLPAAPHLDVSRVLEAWLAYFLLGMDLESLFGGSSRAEQLLIYSRSKKGPLLLGKAILFHWAYSSRRNVCGSMGQERGHLSSHPDQPVNPGDQWGDRGRSQITLTFKGYLKTKDYIGRDKR